MRRIFGTGLQACLFGLMMVNACSSSQAQSSEAPEHAYRASYPDPSGITTTLSNEGPVPSRGAFAQSFGINGRSCASCHVPEQGMSISALGARERFLETRGRDPLFAAVDGANCPSARADSLVDHSLLLQHGLIRVFIAPPATAQYTISVVRDPYGCAMTPNPAGGPPLVSVYRRPLPTTNLTLLSTIMFDGRETVAPLNVASSFTPNLNTDLLHQAADAITTHAQAPAPPASEILQQIVNFELGLSSAQSFDASAGRLHAHGADGGPRYLAEVVAKNYYPGINDSLGSDPDGHAFNPAAMSLYAPWALAREGGGNYWAERQAEAQRDIAAGEQIFNSTPVHISNVRGLNDNPALGSPAVFAGTCTTCHDTPNTGNHSFPLPLDIGTSHVPSPAYESDPQVAAGLAELSVPELPIYLVSGCPNPFSAGQPESFYTSDPGKALVTGLCSDFNRGKGPILRGLAARAPYFHNGAAANLSELVNFYNQRFQMQLTEEQKRQLTAFLNAL